jgi:hypothetical protein
MNQKRTEHRNNKQNPDTTVFAEYHGAPKKRTLLVYQLA